MTVKTRFAPSPTGYLHIGNARAALFCWLYARAQGGQFLLRIDDTDMARSTAEYETAIREDLTWLGLNWDELEHQSKRFARYDDIFEQLKTSGLVYPCYETADELERKRKRQRARGKPPVYDRAALSLSADEISAFEAEGRKPHWRFKLSGERVVWQDAIRGQQDIDTASLSDPILVREDGSYLYTLPSVIDDMDFSVTHIIRGEDHVTNTATQIELFSALGGEIPLFAHFSLLQTAEGTGLSKRDGVLSLRDLQQQGVEAMAVNSLVARLGSADVIEPVKDMKTLWQGFEFAKLSRASARFDVEELLRLNAKRLHDLSYQEVAPRLDELNLAIDETFWEAVRGNLNTLIEIKDYIAIVNGEVTPVIDAEDREFIKTARDHLPPPPLTEESWKIWTDSLKHETQRKGRALFMPLRKALTGQEHGPEMKTLLSLLDHQTVVARLMG